MKKLITISLLTALTYAPIAQCYSMPTKNEILEYASDLKGSASDRAGEAGKYLADKKDELVKGSKDMYSQYAPVVKEATAHYTNAAKEGAQYAYDVTKENATNTWNYLGDKKDELVKGSKDMYSQYAPVVKETTTHYVNAAKDGLKSAGNSITANSQYVYELAKQNPKTTAAIAAVTTLGSYLAWKAYKSYKSSKDQEIKVNVVINPEGRKAINDLAQAFREHAQAQQGK